MQQLEQEDTELSKDEQSLLSGLSQQPEESLLDEKYSLESSWKEEKDPARNGALRIGFVLIGIGLFIMVGFALWNLFSASPKQDKMPEISEAPQSASKTDTSENDQLKAELALRGQQNQRQQSTEELKLRNPVYNKNKTKVAIKSAPTPPIKSAPTTAPVPKPLPKVEKVEKVNPVQSWNQLSNLGLSSADIPETTEVAANGITDSNNQGSTSTQDDKSAITGTNSTNSTTSTASNTSTLLKEVVIGQTGSSPLATGKYGILNRTNTVNEAQRTKTEKEIPIGTIAKGEIVVPMISAFSAKDKSLGQAQTKGAIDTDGLFVIKLGEDLTDSEQRVILPVGTMFVVNAKNISNTNGYVNADVVAVIYRDSNGKNVQQQIAQGAIIALGEEQEPLVAEGSFDPGDEIAGNDILLGALSSLSQIGQMLNQPKSVSQINSAFSSSITTTNDPNLLGAVLQGFFQPIASNLSSRSQEVIQKLQQRESVAVLPVGKQVSLIIKGFVKVEI